MRVYASLDDSSWKEGREGIVGRWRQLTVLATLNNRDTDELYDGTVSRNR